MSKPIIDIIVDYTNEKQRPLMLIASRNQIDERSGYVMTTKELAQHVSDKKTDNILICRDHCGPYFYDNEKNLSITEAIDATKRTIACDIENGFDLIHIDTSRVSENPYQVAEELIKFALDLNPNIILEFGSEENVGVAAGVEKYKNDLAFAQQFKNTKFVVAQTGSLCFDGQQTGTFDQDIVSELVALANQNNIGLKEHNADYLSADQLQQRKTTGVHAMNIAPQLGIVQTQCLRRLSNNRGYQQQWNDFCNTVISGNKYQKWTSSESDAKKVEVSGHYFFKTLDYYRVLACVNQHVNFNAYLKNEIYKILDLYYENFQ